MLAKRARELNMGAATDIDKDLNKVIPIVLQEMIEGRIRYEELKE
jgi:DNA-directed RNA polymerase subunit K/omega